MMFGQDSPLKDISQGFSHSISERRENTPIYLPIYVESAPLQVSSGRRNVGSGHLGTLIPQLLAATSHY